MYEAVYGFSGPPFQLTPDARFFFASQGHSRAFAHLSFGLQQGEGFIVITGEVGAGKTTLVEHFCAEHDHDAYRIARIATTQLSGDELFRLAMADFGIAIEGLDKAAIIVRFQAMLRAHRGAGRRCLLVVDEAQNLSRSAIEELRMLSNLTESGHAALQTILLGQPEFRQMLASPDLDQLRQRVIAAFHLGPLDPAETQAYVEHRLTRVGWAGHPAIEPAAHAAIYQATGGIPRRINRLAARVLLLAALDGTAMLTVGMVHETARELDADLSGASANALLQPIRPDLSLREVHDGVMAKHVQGLEMVFHHLLGLLKAPR